MHLFAKERPEISPGQKALLLDGSAIPHITVTPLESGLFQLSTHLRNYSVNERSYSYYTIEIDAIELGSFFGEYCRDPETTLWAYFNWRAQTIVRKHIPASPITSGRIHQMTEDLL